MRANGPTNAASTHARTHARTHPAEERRGARAPDTTGGGGSRPSALLPRAGQPASQRVATPCCSQPATPLSLSLSLSWRLHAAKGPHLQRKQALALARRAPFSLPPCFAMALQRRSGTNSQPPGQRPGNECGGVCSEEDADAADGRRLAGRGVLLSCVCCTVEASDKSRDNSLRTV